MATYDDRFRPFVLVGGGLDVLHLGRFPLIVTVELSWCFGVEEGGGGFV
jgi:hypothetical protein